MQPKSIGHRTRQTHTVSQKVLICLFLVLIMMGGVFLRTYNIGWDQGKHLHPDERFLSDVLSRIEPVQADVSYFDTSQSNLNPGNKGLDFFVYGTAPIFIIRYLGELTGQVGYDRITYLGRALSALADSMTILLVFLIAQRLYNWKVGLLAAAFYACAVLPIQQAHFMTVDTFTSTFGMLTVYAAVLIAQLKWAENWRIPNHSKWKVVWPYLLFGVGLGLATASKINAISLALLLPIIEIIRSQKAADDYKGTILLWGVGYCLLAAVASFLVFRVAQPYAFNGPGFFNVSINPKWLAAMQSLRAQSSGNVDFPPALQWARRNWWFSIKNLALWGIGLPFALAALAGFALMARGMIKYRQWEHLPLWLWTLFYFLWQSTAWVKSMRYFLLIYPLLAILAAWGIFRLVDRSNDFRQKKLRLSVGLLKKAGIVLGVLAILGSAAWAFSFTRIYSRQHTRVDASEWIYTNIPGPINLISSQGGNQQSQPLPVRIFDQVHPGEIYYFPFTVDYSGRLQSFMIPKVWTTERITAPVNFSAEVFDGVNSISGRVSAKYVQPDDGSMVTAVSFIFEMPVTVNPGRQYSLHLINESPDLPVLMREAPQITLIRDDNNMSAVKVLNKIVETIRSGKPVHLQYYLETAQVIEKMRLPFVADLSQTPDLKTLKISLILGESVAVAEAQSEFLNLGDGRGEALEISFNQPLVVSQPGVLSIDLELVAGDGQLAIFQYAPAHESTWDDALPLILSGLSAYNSDSGLLRDDLNLELYWPDDDSKLQRLLNTLDNADYVFISSNRQWGTTTRVPERYPLTTAYYQGLMGCPIQVDVVTCYNNAIPGMYTGRFGFELIKTQTSYPTFMGWSFNDQFAEEAFSVYDHPKVLIFKKTADYDRKTVEDFLSQVDLTKVVFLTPKQADTYKPESGNSADLLSLSPERWAKERETGTWTELFNRDSLLNQNPILSVAVFYLFASLLGLIAFPLVFLGMSGLKDRGYGFARLAGILLFGFAAFNLGSAGFAVTRNLLLMILVGLALLSLVLYFLNWQKIIQFIKHNWKRLLVIELVALICFGFFLWIRTQNPDLWHPSKGGEKPMDFSYLNAIIKSENFPPYDPWYAGGYINYYYYGLLLVAMPVKLLGIIPASAYNIILPLWYAITMVGAYSIGYNLYASIAQTRNLQKRTGMWSTVSGVITAVFLGFLGNLGEVKLLSEVFRGLGGGPLFNPDASFVQQAIWFFRGIGQYLKKVPYPMDPGAWYWNPSRAIPGDVITEFPYFTFIYADLHAHLIAMPIVIFAVGWALSFLLSKGRWGENRRENLCGLLISLLLGGLVIGAIKPTNTWDFYTFLILGCAVIAFVGWKYGLSVLPRIKRMSPQLSKLMQIGMTIFVFIFLSYVLYQPFNSQFHPGFSKVGMWSGEKTPIKSYLTHWGVILFTIVSWFVWESYRWMARTPVSFFKKLKRYRQTVTIVGVVFSLAFLLLLVLKVKIALIAVPLCVWALLLLLIPQQSDVKRFMLFIVGTGLLLTLMVEVVYLEGEIGRMNTVFKFYLQAWLLLTLVSGAAIVSLLRAHSRWKLHEQLLFQVPLMILVAGALLFPMLGTISKVKDRIVPDASQGIDGMGYMQTAWNFDMGVNMDLSQDYRAILWLQDNVSGSPVILEGFRGYEYRWNNRMTIYTGLPGVVGWNYHQRQQRGILRNNAVQERVDEVDKFYLSTNLRFMRGFLEKYQVEYIIVGQVERAFYPEVDFTKFKQLDGIFWTKVYEEQETAIYQVIHQ